MYDRLINIEENPSAYQKQEPIPGSKRWWEYDIPGIGKKKRTKNKNETEYSSPEIKFHRIHKQNNNSEITADFFYDLENVIDVSSKRDYIREPHTIREDAKPINGDDLRYDMEINFMESFYGGQKNFRYKHPISNEKKNLIVKFSRGIKDNQKLRIKGKGLPGLNGGKDGDLYVIIHVKEHPIFKRIDDDVYITLEIPFTMAIFGGKSKVSGLEKSLNITIPRLTKDSTILRVKEHGFFNINTHERGNLFVEIKLKIPDKLNQFQKKKLLELRDLGL